MALLELKNLKTFFATKRGTVKAVNGSTTLTATSNGTAKFYLPNTGTWSVTATKNGETRARCSASSANPVPARVSRP